MNIFISWSGERSLKVAEALKALLEAVILNPEVDDVFISSQDIKAGEEWFKAIADALSEPRFGVLCLTKGNTITPCLAPWLAFEAGALMNAFGKGRACPFLIDKIGKNDLGPLSLFQAVDSSRAGTWKLIQSIVGDCSAKKHQLFVNRFADSWPHFAKILKEVQQQEDLLTPVEDGEVEQLIASLRHSVEETLKEIRHQKGAPALTEQLLQQMSLQQTKIDALSHMLEAFGRSFMAPEPQPSPRKRRNG